MNENEKHDKKAYNLKLTPMGEIDTTPTAKGTPKKRFTAFYVSKGKTFTRTVIAQGKAAREIEGMVEEGKPVMLRCLFNRAPANDDGSKGGEYLAVVAVPKTQTG